MDNVKAWVNQNRPVVNVLGAILILVVGASLLGNLFDGDDPIPPASETTLGTSSSVPHEPDEEPQSEVGPIDCSPLVTFTEVYEALGVGDTPNASVSETSQFETCFEPLISDPAYFVQIGPGTPGDLDPGAEIIGVTGEPIEDLGDGAAWFGGPGASDGGAYGMVVVRKNSEVGDIYFRLTLGRPDLDEAAQREIAIGLARVAIPRFPGVVVEPEVVEPEVITFEDEPPPDPSRRDLDSNLEAKVASGEWSLGEGLVATLSYLAQEPNAAVIGDDLLDTSGTLVISMAQEYLETGDDPALQAEVGRLLDLLLLSDAEIETLLARTSASGLLVSAIPLAQVADPCTDPQSVEPCYDQIPVGTIPGVAAGKYTLWADLIKGTAWTADDIASVKQSIFDSAVKFEALGEIPPVMVMLEPSGDRLFVGFDTDKCTVYIGPERAELGDAYFRQVLAREISFCLIGSVFFDKLNANGQSSRMGDNPSTWWVKGLSNYLSGYVYPVVNFEHLSLPESLSAEELSTKLNQRGWTNWIFFEYLHAFGGAEENLARIATFPIGDDGINTLRDLPGMQELFHDFELALTDANINDLGPGAVPYSPATWELTVAGPSEVGMAIPQFGLRRLHIIVPDGLYACFETSQNGFQRSSWRIGEPGTPGTWSEDPPVVLEGEYVLVVTAVDAGSTFTLDVIDLDENPDCEDEEDPGSSIPELCGLCSPSRYYYRR